MAEKVLKGDKVLHTSNSPFQEFGVKNSQPLRGEMEIKNYHQQILDNLPAAIYTCDIEGRITMFNDAAVELWGRTPKVGKDMWCGSWKIYNTDGSPLSLDACPMAITLKEGKAVTGVEIVIERPDGQRRNILPHPRPLFDSAGNLIGAVNMLVDITSLKSTEVLNKKNEELRKSEERYHRMIGEVEDYAIILLNENGDIENWNKGAEKIKGYKAEEIIGKNFSIFYLKEDQESGLPQRLINLAKKEGRAAHEGWRKRKDGTRFWGSITITALHNDNNSVIGYSKVTRDLTAKKIADDELKENALRLEGQNRQLETMNQELASFAYVSSHDLQEPLRKIQTFASRIIETENESLSERAKDYFGRMQNAASRMQNLIEDLLTYSRTNTADQKFENINLNTILDEVKHDLKEAITEKHAVIKSATLPTIKGVAFQLRQLFTNILSNALKFSKDGTPPEINITVDKIIDNDINALSKNQSYHHIAVKDNGIGFESEHSHKIFEVFQRLHGRSEYSGTGIGLAICKKIADNHGGKITAESELEQGATFHIYLPE